MSRSKGKHFEAERRRARKTLFEVASFAMIGLGVPYAIQIALAGNIGLACVVVTALVLAAALVVYTRRGGSPMLAGALGTMVYSGLVVGGTLFTGGPSDSALDWIYIAPMLGLAVATPRMGLVVAGASIVVVVAYWFFERHGYVATNYTPEDMRDTQRLVNSVGALVGLTVIGWVVSRQQQAVESDVQRSMDALSSESDLTFALSTIAVIANESRSLDFASHQVFAVLSECFPGVEISLLNEGDSESVAGDRFCIVVTGCTLEAGSSADAAIGVDLCTPLRIRADGPTPKPPARLREALQFGANQLRLVQFREADSRRIYELSYIDLLTGLPSRRAFMRTMDTWLAARSEVVVMFLDLDRFKDANDVLGHTVGDKLLSAVGSALRVALVAELGENGPWYLARLGGDEFGVALAVDVADGDVNRLALRLINAVEAPMVVDGVRFRTSVSVGWARAPEDGVDVETLLRRADMAMYVAKGRETGSRPVRRFDSSTGDRVSRRLFLSNHLPQAIEDRSLRVVYQPIYSAGRKLSAFEALVRWKHNGESIPPGDFVPVAEQVGLAHDLDSYVLQRVAKEISSWPDDIRVAVNISSVHLTRDDLLEIVSQPFLERGIHPARIDVEITETALVHADARVVARLGTLQELGFGITIDDFGVGSSSLHRLRLLPVTTLKIDRAFVSELPGDLRFCKTIAHLGHVLGLSIVAEGVESEEQSRALDQMGCDFQQGFYLGIPLEFDSATRLILEARSAA